MLSVSLTQKVSLFQNAFVVGTGKLSVWAAGANGTAGAAVPSGPPIFQVDIPLTPGPLVVVLKDKWPPTKPENVEVRNFDGNLGKFDGSFPIFWHI